MIEMRCRASPERAAQKQVLFYYIKKVGDMNHPQKQEVLNKSIKPQFFNFRIQQNFKISFDF
jgi:hypothetical protein